MRHRHADFLVLKKEDTVFDRVENLMIRGASSLVTSDELLKEAESIDVQLRQAIARRDDLKAEQGLSKAFSEALLRGISDVFLEPIDPRAATALNYICNEIDATLETQPDYHYNAHFYNVALMDCLLGVVAARRLGDKNLTAQKIQRRAVVGLLHDLYHTGGNNQYFLSPEGNQNEIYRPFFFERNTNRKSRELLSKAGYSPDEIEEIQMLVLATEPRTMPAILRKAHQFHAAETVEQKEKLKAAALESLQNAFADVKMQDPREEPSRMEIALIEKLFAQGSVAERKASREFLSECLCLTSSDLSFSLISPDSHAGMTGRLYHEFNENGVANVKLYEKDALDYEGTKAFCIYIAEIPFDENGQVHEDSRHPEPSVQYLLWPSMLKTASVILAEAQQSFPARVAPSTVKNHAAPKTARATFPKHKYNATHLTL